MSTAVPTEIRARIKLLLWHQADNLGWSKLPDSERATWYENWSKDKEIGGVLSHFMDARKVRVYIKDSLLKPYLRSRTEDEWCKVAGLLGISSDPQLQQEKFEKPHGMRLRDGKVICWGHSRDWKGVLISAVERAYVGSCSEPFGIVLVESGTTIDVNRRRMIVEIGNRLGIGQVAWLD